MKQVAEMRTSAHAGYAGDNSDTPELGAFLRDAMAVMEGRGQEWPPRQLGDDPHGFYWTAVRPEQDVQIDDEQDEYVVEGSDLEIMWDEGAGPLWTTEDGLLPDDPESLKRALGLSDSLVADLFTWLRDMDMAPCQYPPTEQLDERAQQLAERLQVEVGPRFTVRYHR
jgi:hypothetical protein